MHSELSLRSPLENPETKDIDVLIIGGIHGDEPSGPYAIEKLREQIQEDQLTKTIGFLIGNPRAIEQDVRYTEEDLNRVFKEEKLTGGSYESQLARSIRSLINTADSVLSIHSTQSFNEPFGLVSIELNHHIKRSLFKTSLSKAVRYPEEQHRGSLVQFSNVLEIEAGYQKSQSAKNNALRIAKEFLHAQYVYKEKHSEEKQWSDVMLYQITGKIPKSGRTNLQAENFTQVSSDSVYATTSDKSHKSNGTFTPILMSEEGYESILGYKSKHLGWLSEYV